MWKCHKCGKPVYFAERKQSLGYDWHPECLRCEECGKRLNPGLHAEHKGVPYCHVPCYGALFGPQLFGHGTRVESHKSFGVKGAQRATAAGTAGPALPRDHLESKLKVYNQFFNNRSHEIRCREVNDRLVLEGALRICWGVQGVIHLKEDDDQRTVITVRKRNSCRLNANDIDSDRNADDYYHDREAPEDAALDLTNEYSTAETNGGGDSTDVSLTESISYDTCSLAEDSSTSAGTSKDNSPDHRSQTLPSKLEAIKQLEWDDLDELLQVERKLDDSAKMYQTLPSTIPSSSGGSSIAAAAAAVAKPDDDDDYPTSTSTNFSTAASITEDDSSRTLTKDFERCLELSDDSPTSTTEPTTTNSEEYMTPNSTLKNVDYDLFKKQMHEEYINNSNQLQATNDGSLKSNQPIDPSRINDSLKLYSENMMSKSFCGAEPALRICPPSSLQYQTLGAIDPQKLQDTFGLVPRMNGGGSGGDGHHRNYALQKSGSASSRIISSEHENWLEKGLNRSKSGPNCFDSHNNSSDSENCETLKPSTIRKNHEMYNSRMADGYTDHRDEPRSTTATMASSNSFPSSCENGAAMSNSSFTTTPTTDSSCTADSMVMSSNSVTEPTTTATQTTSTTHGSGCEDCCCQPDDGVVLRRHKTGSTAIKRRSGNKRSRAKLKRRCSINGHFYNRETSFFTPPRGSQMSVWVTSLVSTQDVIQLLLEKYKVDSRPENFALFVVRDNGEQKRLKDDEYPLVTRIMMGPHEEVAKLFLMDAQSTTEISSEVAQFLNLSIPECRAIIDRYNTEFEREAQKVRDRYAEMKRRIVQRMDSLKVRL